MKVKKNLRRTKNPPSQENSEFPIVPVMAMFLVFAGLGVFVYWDRRRRTINPNRPQLTSNFTPQQFRTQLQVPAFQASNLDPDGVPTWMNRDTTNPQIDRWLNDPSYWSSESLGGSGSSGQQTSQTQTNQTQTNQQGSGSERKSVGFVAILDDSTNVRYRDRLREIKNSVVHSLAAEGNQIITELNDTERLNSLFTERFGTSGQNFISGIPTIFTELVPSGRYSNPTYIAGQASESGNDVIIAASLYSSSGQQIKTMSITVPGAELRTGQATNRIAEEIVTRLNPNFEF